MRKILIMSLISLALPLAATAQTTPPKKDAVKEAPKVETKKAETKKAETSEKVQDTIDLDTFFKKGEENAQSSSCNKPAIPADPIA